MKMPKELLIYVCDYDDGKPIFAVANNVEGIPENCNGEKVGKYVLSEEHRFKVKRQLV